MRRAVGPFLLDKNGEPVREDVDTYPLNHLAVWVEVDKDDCLDV